MKTSHHFRNSGVWKQTQGGEGVRYGNPRPMWAGGEAGGQEMWGGGDGGSWWVGKLNVLLLLLLPLAVIAVIAVVVVVSCASCVMVHGVNPL